MAVVDTANLQNCRRILANGRTPTWTKAHVNAAIQAIEDAVQSSSNVGGRSLKNYIGNAIETAAPGIFNAQLKDDLFVIWCRFNVERGGIL